MRKRSFAYKQRRAQRPRRQARAIKRLLGKAPAFYFLPSFQDYVRNVQR